MSIPFSTLRTTYKPINLAIFCSRESFFKATHTIRNAINAIPRGSIVDVLVNGNPVLSEQIDLWIKSTTLGNNVRVWQILAADKGNAWNQHIHKIWPGTLDTVYIDGYVQISSSAICALTHTLANHPEALGTSGLPTVGYSARATRKTAIEEGGLHGNLCAIKAEALDQMRKRQIRIPLGMYRVDSIVGAFLSFGLNNLQNAWNPELFIPLTPDATWTCDQKKWYRAKDWLDWKNRRARQAKGDFENLAVKYQLAVLKTKLEDLPNDVNALIIEWQSGLAHNSMGAHVVSRRHQAALALLLRYTPPPLADLVATEIEA